MSNAKEQLKKAYIKLLSKKNYLDITVSDLVNEAGVARVTYYRLYNSFDEILNDISNDFFETIHENISVATRPENIDPNVKTFLAKCFTSIKDNHSFTESILRENAEYLFDRLGKKFSNVNENHLQPMDNKGKMFMAMCVSAVVGTARYWTLNGYKETAEELAESVYNFLKQQF